jgi:hypothetical protein
MASTNPYVDYYVNQVGHGHPAYGGVSVQHGRGLGQTIGNLFRSAVPLLKRGALALGKKALTTGARIVGDIASGQKFGDAMKGRLQEGAKELLDQAVESVASPKKAKKPKKTRSAPYSMKQHKRRRVTTSDVSLPNILDE